MTKLANILTALFYISAIGLCGWNAYYPNSSWHAAGVASAQMFGALVALLFTFHMFRTSLHSPEGRIAQWIVRRRAREMPLK